MNQRAWLVTLALCASTAFTPVLTGRQTTVEGPQPLEVLNRWIAAVHEHEPGMRDASLDEVGSWPTAQLEALYPYVKALSELAGPGEMAPQLLVVFDRTERELLTMTANREAARAGVNTLMKRGALLHTDLGILPPEPDAPTTPAPRPPPLRRPPGRPTFLPSRMAVKGNDGLYAGIERQTIHWEFARTLLNSTMPNPGTDDWVRRWYLAVAAYFAESYGLAETLHHLTRARQLFPRDAEVLIASGCMHETMASPEIQSVAQTTALPRGVKINITSAGSNLRDAERYYRQALEHNPDLAAARVRLARVLLQRDRVDEAMRQLQRVMPATSDPVLRYYVYLFTAEAEQARGNAGAAAAAYETAAALYPRAQSPRLALSHLARDRGDRAAALEAIQQVLLLPGDEQERLDPWWNYHRGAGRRAAALLEEVRAPFRGGDR